MQETHLLQDLSVVQETSGRLLVFEENQGVYIGGDGICRNTGRVGVLGVGEKKKE